MKPLIYCVALVVWACLLRSSSAEEALASDVVERIQRAKVAIAQLQADSPALAEKLRHELQDALDAVEDKLDPAGRFRAKADARHRGAVAKIRAMLDRMIDESPSDLVALNDRLRRLDEAWNDGSIFLESSEQPLVQWLHASHLEEQASNVRTDGRQELEITVKDIGRPSIIVLSSSNATAWKIRVEESAQVATVLLFSHADILDSDQPLLIYRRQGYGRQLTSEAESYLNARIAFEVGQPVDLLLPIFEHDNAIELSTENADWTRAYLHGQLQNLAFDVRSIMNARFAASNSDLRFSGLLMENEGYARTTSYADFSLRGPVPATAKPTGISLWNYVSLDRDRAFGLVHAGNLAKWSPQTTSWSPLSMPSQMFGGTVFHSVCWDSKRQRLLLVDSQGWLFAFAPEESQWTVVRKGLQGLVCIAYRKSDDSVIGLRQHENRGLGQQDGHEVSLVYLDPLGNVTREVRTDCEASIQSPHERAANELTLSDQYLIAVQPPTGGMAHGPARSVIRVFDLDSGTLLYDYMLPNLEGFEHPQSDQPKSTDATRYAAVVERLQVAERAVAELQQDHGDAFEQLTTLLESLRDSATFRKRVPNKPSVHWLRTYYDPVPTIRVTDKSGPLVVALSSFDVNEWQLEIGDGVNLKEVLFVGGQIPEIRGLPPGIPIRIHSEKDVEEQDRQVARQPSYLKSVIENMVDGPLASEFDLRMMSARNVVTIGSGDGDWSAQQVLDELNDVIRRATRLSHENALPETFRFAYLYTGQLPGLGAAHGPPYAVECNFRGPILQTARTVDADFSPTSIGMLKTGQFVVGTRESGLHRLTRKTDGLVVEAMEAAPIQHAVSEIMYDPKTEQLFCLSPRGLHIQQKGSWQTRAHHAAHAEAWCRDNAKRSFHALIRNNRQFVEVHEVSDTGATVRKRKLPVPIACDYNAYGRLFFAFCDSQHIIVVMRNGMPRDGEANRVYVLDMDSLRIVYDGSFAPHVEREDLSEREFEILWEQLATAEESGATSVMWTLVGGLADSAKRIKARLGIVDVISREEIDALVDQLDDDSFAARDEAYQTLSQSGKSHAAYLQALPRDDLSAEQVARIEGLVGIWQDSSVRTQRATEVLKMIELQRAVDSK